MVIKRLHHVQICIPAGEETTAREFYGGILGLKEIPKPDSLKPNGGLWFQAGEIELHIGVENMEGLRSKRHPAFEVEDLQQVRAHLEKHGVRIQDETPIPDVERFSIFDPFGNRIELLERRGSGQQKQLVQSQFGKSAEAYVQSEIHARGKDLAMLVEVAEVTENDWVLDVATGGGHVANALAPWVQKVTALDLTQEMLDAAERLIRGNGHGNVEFVLGDAEHLPFASHTFDVVACRIAAHHFPQVRRFVAEAWRVLKPGGKFLLVDNVAPENDEADRIYNEIEKRRDPSHVRAWKKSEWIRMLEEMDFVIETWRRFPKRFQFQDWCDRMRLSGAQKEALEAFLLSVPKPVQRRLKLETAGEKVVSFQGESVLVKAVKPEA